MFDKLLKLREEAKIVGEPILRDKSFDLLMQIVKDNKPKRILEVGVNVGLSSIGMLLTYEKSTLSGIEINEIKVKEAKENYIKFGVDERANIFIGDASEIIPQLTGNYDLIFLDGPKGHYYEYLPYLLNVLNVGGILFADNVLFRGYVSGVVKTPHRHATIKNSMERFLAEISNSENLSTEILDLEDGVSITKKIK